MICRLARPSLALQHPLPRENDIGISPVAALAYPSKSSDQDFILSANLSLPPSFGSAYVGEMFACALCANNELPEGITKSIPSIRILAEMQTPSQAVPLQLQSSPGDEERHTCEPGNPLQKIISFDLKEEGNHVLAVNLSYTETLSGVGQATSGKVRSFRKLYQFLAQPCLSVRTKATALPSVEVADKSLGPYGRSTLTRFALEAQLENVSDGTIVLEEAKLRPKAPFRSTSLNWDAEVGGENAKAASTPVLCPRDVLQVAYLVEQGRGVSEGLEELKASLKQDGRAMLGQLAISWRGNMGEVGSLSTGSLLSRRRT